AGQGGNPGARRLLAAVVGPERRWLSGGPGGATDARAGGGALALMNEASRSTFPPGGPLPAGHPSAPAKRFLLEVAVASVEDARAAETGGADRVELSAALALGGLTPSLGALLEVRQATRLPL